MLFPIYCETEYEKYYTIDMLKVTRILECINQNKNKRKLVVMATRIYL